MAAIAIIDAALSLVIPLLHRISKADVNGAAVMMPLDERNIAAIDEEIARLKKQIADLEKLRSELGGGGENLNKPV